MSTFTAIKYRHYRYVDGENLLSRGGATVAYLPLINSDTAVSDFTAAVAYCNPRDNYSKQYGRNKAAGRLVQNASCNHNLTDFDKYFFLENTTVEEGLAKLDRHMNDQGMVRL